MKQMKQELAMTVDLAVIGGGPGGYSAAFRAADLGLSVALIEKESRLGGVCLNVGCIPSKTLLHAAEVIREAESAADYGITFTPPSIDLEQLRSHKDSVVKTLTTGLAKMAKARAVTVLTGKGTFTDSHTIAVEESSDGRRTVTFSSAIIASGSSPVPLPAEMVDYSDSRIWDSTKALELSSVPESLVIIGGGIIGLEMAAVYQALGSQIHVVEMLDQIIPSADPDVVRPLMQVIRKRYAGIHTGTRVTGIKQEESRLSVLLEGKKAPGQIAADAVLISVGRRPNTAGLGLETIDLTPDAQGFIAVDDTLRTTVPHIFAIGDVVGNPMLAHKAVHQGKAAAEAAAGLKHGFSALTIPSVAYTDPEVAWMGVTEREATEQGIRYRKGVYPWSASGRALSSGAAKGVSKALFDEESGRLIGAAIVGKHAGELLGEAVLALEMGADAADISLTVHAHPTLSETFAGAAEIVHGSVTDLLPKK